MDLISRKSVDKAIQEWIENREYDCSNATYYLHKRIDKIPSIQPKPKKGHWIAIDEEPHEDYECDKCGYIISTYTANIEPHTEYKYCPNCGAKMESEG